MRVLVTGATGYVGGRLVPRLLRAGHEVVVLVRDESKLGGRPWAPRVGRIVCDLVDRSSVPERFEGFDAAIYLVHSLQAGHGFEQLDRLAAQNFVHAGRDLPRIVYLGALLPKGRVSRHLASRAEVGGILAAAVPTLELRCGPVIGSGSASFEMCRYLVERMPVMVTPRWIDTPVSPIGVRDVLEYLVQALSIDDVGVADIGSEAITFRRMMGGYAEQRGLRRAFVRMPLFAPRAAATWIGLLTPVTREVAVPLVLGMTAPLAADTARARALFPGIDPMPYEGAVSLALKRTGDNQVETRWSGSGVLPHVDWEGAFQERRVRRVSASPDQTWRAVQRLGGDHGWGPWTWAWRLRGAMDRLAGGPGRRGDRRDVLALRVGDTVDFWRVEEASPWTLVLRAEMRIPGEARLVLECLPDGSATHLVMSALFVPHGALGPPYWYAMAPIHRPLFDSLVDAIATDAERFARSDARSVAKAAAS